MSQKERPYGLSKVVTLAVLPRLYMEELVLELGRRNITAQNSSNREDLISTLADLIMREFCGLTAENSSNSEEQPRTSTEADSRSCESSATPTEVVSNSNSRTQMVATTSSTALTVSTVQKRKQRDNEFATSSGVAMTTPSKGENLEEPRAKKQQTEKYCSATVTSTEEPPQANLSRQLSQGSNENEGLHLENSPSSDVVLIKVEPALERENVGQNSWTNFRQTTQDVQEQADVGSGASDYLVRVEEGLGRRYGDVYGGLGNAGEAVTEWCVEENVVVDAGVSMEMDQSLLNQQQQEMEMPEASCSTRKLHRCPHCNYATTWSSVLTRHLRTHTGEKPFKCPDCDYSASQKGTLDRHMAVHNGERPFVCSECGYRAIDKSRLTRHFKTHSQNKLYVCDLCGFSTQDGVPVHSP
ncbi:PREDICTED: zinc finger protein 37-like [Branchiostoma belcheri]|uniref:Zinc finger protein 37-like n=1 Tax=Branchiostoma belcheri TaxID=7741 RepID=A0A6P4YPT9_BRABE|nr:PREDICTED: zinc finger protein 37-like [Branchiostoma belcheri]